MSGKAVSLTNGDFVETIREGVSLVDFWAPWCGPCMTQIPIVEEVAAEIGERATVAKMNVEDAGTIAAQYGIRSIPTLLVFRDGEAVQQFVGVQSKDVLLTAIESALATEGAVAQ